MFVCRKQSRCRLASAFMWPTPAHGPHIMPRHPIKLMSHAEFTEAVGLPGKQVPFVTGILECKQCSSCTLISIFYTPLFALQNIRVISIKCPLNLFSYLKSANRVTLIMRMYHTSDANRNCALTRDISADN